MRKKSRIAVFASGDGSNAEEIFKYFRDHSAIEVVLLLSNNSEANVLIRAQKFSIPFRVFSKKEFIESEVVLLWLKDKQVTHLVLAGFLWLIPQYLIKAFPQSIINIHPALLPKFGGRGMYGIKVHEAVKQSGEKETGITIHLVNEKYDDGQVLFQSKCDIDPSDTPGLIAKKVHKLEYASYPKIIEKWIDK